MQLLNSKIFVILFFVLFVNEVSFSQSKENIIKSVLFEKFINYIEWPEFEKEADFRISFFGKSEFGKSLKLILSKIIIKNKKLKFSKFENQDKLPHIIVVGNNEEKNLKKLIRKFKNKPVLLITDQPEISSAELHIKIYLNEQNNIRFKFNRKLFNETGLYVSNMLLRYAEVID